MVGVSRTEPTDNESDTEHISAGRNARGHIVVTRTVAGQTPSRARGISTHQPATTGIKVPLLLWCRVDVWGGEAYGFGGEVYEFGDFDELCGHVLDEVELGLCVFVGVEGHWGVSFELRAAASLRASNAG